MTFTFAKAGNRELPQVVGQLTVLPKHWWEGTDKDGKKRNIGETTLDPPLGCGPYRIKEFSPGHNVVYERVKDYWGNGVNVNIGRDNFGTLRFEYFRDATVAIEGFKNGSVDWRTENSAKSWATAYDFPAVTEKRVILEQFPINNIGIMQALRLQHPPRQVQGPAGAARLQLRVQFRGDEQEDLLRPVQAASPATSRAPTSPALGLPTAARLELLETVRKKVPPEVLPEALHQSGQRQAERRAQQFAPRNATVPRCRLRGARPAMVNAKTGEQFSVEMLANAPLFERVFLFYKPWLERPAWPCRCARSMRRSSRTGCAAGISTSSPMPGVNRCCPATSSATTGAPQAADSPGTENIIGIKDPAVDAMIDKIVVRQDAGRATSRDPRARPHPAVESLRGAAVEPTANCAPRVGTASAVRRSCRNTASRRFRRCGGGSGEAAKAAKADGSRQ